MNYLTVFVILVFLDIKSGWTKIYKNSAYKYNKIAFEKEGKRDCEKDIQTENMQGVAINACASDHTN